jgi:hypothetical protein
MRLHGTSVSGSVRRPHLRRHAESCDLGTASVHYVGMACSVRGLSAGCALAAQLACGLETVELGGGSAGDTGSVPAADEQQRTQDQVGTATANGEQSPVPSSGPLEGAANFEFPSDPAAPQSGCQKVDFLFVIDNSPSMAFAQQNLKNSFPGFLKVLGDNLEANDFQIMVVDTDSRDVERAPDEAVVVDRCIDTLGAGRRTNGETDEECGLADSQRFVTVGQPEAELDATFSCMASVGTQGDDREQQVGALLAAVSPAENDAGGCNETFLRRDAILVVTIITNTDDQETLRNPQDWYDELLLRKDGKEASIVVLGFLPGDAFAPESSGIACRLLAGFTPAPRLFTHNQPASVCAENYGPSFEAAVANIDLACDRFVPPIE